MTLRSRLSTMDDRIVAWFREDLASFEAGAERASPGLSSRFVLASLASMIAVLTGAFPAMLVFALGGNLLAWLYVAPPVASFAAVVGYARGGRVVGIVAAVLCGIPPFIGVLFGDGRWHGDLGWSAVYGVGFALQMLGIVLCLPRWGGARPSSRPA